MSSPYDAENDEPPPYHLYFTVGSGCVAYTERYLQPLCCRGSMKREIVILCGTLAPNKLCWGPEALTWACGLPSSWRWLVLPPVSSPSGFGSPPPTFQLLGECLLVNACKQLLSLWSSYLYMKCSDVAVGKEPQWRWQHLVLVQGQKGREILSWF